MVDDFYIDSETCGLVGPMVLFQYAINDGPVTLHEVWRTPARRTLDLIERVVDNNEIGFNLVFDHFHIQKIQNMLAALPKRSLGNAPRIADMAAIERVAPLLGNCVKPRAPLDIYLNLIIGPFQSLMERKPIRIRRVPEMVAEGLVAELSAALQFDWIYTHRRKDGPAWKIQPSKDAPGFVDVSFSFGASRTLKSIHRYVFDSDPILFPMPEEMYPVETQWSPYHDNVPGSWPDRIAEHINYWAENKKARQYGKDDVTMVRDLRGKFGGTPGDMESTLACLIGSVRYRGFPIDIQGVSRELKRSVKKSQMAGDLDWRKVLPKLHELCQDPLEVSIITSTKDEALEPLVKWIGDDGKEGSHPVAKYATKVREARKHRFRAQWLAKLETAGRFHPSLSPVGTLTRRASGSGGFNPQNIDKEDETRGLFVLADTAKTLEQYVWFLQEKVGTFSDKPSKLASLMGAWRGCIGDFDSFETVLAIAAWQDELLQHYVDNGIKPYHVFGSFLYRRDLGGPTADSKIALEEIRKDKNYVQYASRAKNCWYALIYGAQEFKISQTAGVPIEHVAEALKAMSDECVGMARGRQKVFDALSCIVQEEEGKAFCWNEPESKVANIQGWERDFAFEVGIIKILFGMPNRLPRDWREIETKVVRKNREQTVYGAVCSAIFGAAKQMEARMKRQAGNCIMQSSGAMYCKDLQVRQWDAAQPHGIHPWQIVLLNIHDEIDGALRRMVSVLSVTKAALREYAEKVPLVKMQWQETGVNSWADKE
jgi:hypothetical protein